MPEGRYNVIVIGGGVGGLAVAALAARRGLRPLVVEQGETPGGACATLVRGGYRFDAGASLLWGFEEGGSLRRLLEEVAHPIEAAPVDPGIQVALPRHRFGFYRKEERFWREIRREFAEGGAAFRALYAELVPLDGALRDLDLGAGDLPACSAWHRLRRWGRRGPAEKTLQQRGHDSLEALPAWRTLPPEIQRALTVVLRHLGHASPASPVLLAATILGLTRGEFTVLRGGVGGLVEGLVRAVERYGGTVRLGTRAVEILLRGHRAVGVRGADGVALEASTVVAAVTPGLLAGQLVPHGVRALPVGPPAPSAAALTLYLGADEAVLPAEMGPQVFLALPEALGADGIDALALGVSPPWDGSRAPKGRRALTVNAYLPLRADGLAAADWLQIGERVLNALDDFLPGLRGRMDYCEVRSPIAWQEQTGRPYGAAGYARGSLPVFLGWQGFPHATSVPGLFVAGDWTFPGGGVAAVAEGARRAVDLLMAARR